MYVRACVCVEEEEEGAAVVVVVARLLAVRSLERCVRKEEVGRQDKSNGSPRRRRLEIPVSKTWKSGGKTKWMISFSSQFMIKTSDDLIW